MIQLEHGSAEPASDQVKRQLSEQISAGELAPGSKLPTVRALAEQLGLAPNTVAKAYRELESSGLIDTRGRAGTFVSGDGVAASARQAAADYVRRVRELGLSPSEALALVQRSLASGR
jgi:DNA-binding transcriptional regulator YhcF (GntR family)